MRKFLVLVYCWNYPIRWHYYIFSSGHLKLRSSGTELRSSFLWLMKPHDTHDIKVGVLQNHRPTDRSSTDLPTTKTDSPTIASPTHRPPTHGHALYRSTDHWPSTHWQVLHQHTDHRLTNPPTTDSPTLLQLTTSPLTQQTYFNRSHYWTSSFNN